MRMFLGLFALLATLGIVVFLYSQSMDQVAGDVNMKVNVDARLEDLKTKVDAENKINQDELGIDTSTLRLQY
jgi:CHASE3 domain sensor protein